jgi:dCTP deaminase
MILSRRELLAAWRKRKIRFSPDITQAQIGLSSIDLRLGYIFSRLKPARGVVVQPARRFDPTNLVETQDFSQTPVLGKPPTFKLPSMEFRLAFTLEEVTLPPDLAANVQGKSSLARAGLAIHITAPHIHPGWAGNITLELYNHGPWELELFPGEDLVCQLILFKVASPVDRAAVKALSTYVRQKSPFPTREPERPMSTRYR